MSPMRLSAERLASTSAPTQVAVASTLQMARGGARAVNCVLVEAAGNDGVSITTFHCNGSFVIM